MPRSGRLGLVDVGSAGAVRLLFFFALRAPRKTQRNSGESYISRRAINSRRCYAVSVGMTHWSGLILHSDVANTDRSAEVHIRFVRASAIFFSVRAKPMLDIAPLRYPSPVAATSSKRRFSDVRDPFVRMSKRGLESVRSVIGIRPFGTNLPKSDESVKAWSKRSTKAISWAARTDRVTRQALYDFKHNDTIRSFPSAKNTR